MAALGAAALVALAVAAGCGNVTTPPTTSGTSTSGTSSSSTSTAGMASYTQAQVEGYYKANGTATVTAGTPVTIDAGDLFFKPNTLTVAKGTKVQLTVKNTGAIEHTFTFPEYSINDVLQPGASQSVSFTASTAGTFYWYCAVPGHAAAGMVGQLTVS